MQTLPLLLRNIKYHPDMTQRELAKTLEISLGKVNQSLKEAQDAGYINVSEGNYQLTGSGSSYLENYRVDNAVIIAAGFGSRFVPLTFETPKGLLKVFGERMIERQIKHLHEAGIHDITIMVGYLKEKFEYLIDKYQVTLIYNPEYASKNTLTTLYHCRHLLGNTYILPSDNWIRENIFHLYEPDAWYCSTYMKGETSEWCLKTDKKGRIVDVTIGGSDSYVMYGPAYFDRSFSEKFVPLLERYYSRPGTEDYHWEQVFMQNLSDLPMHIYRQPEDMVYEFENLEELRRFDSKYQNHSENDALEKIAEIFQIPESEITGIQCLKSGMTNKSFLFAVKGEQYIFRIPGQGTDFLINRRQEKACYEAVAPLHLSDEVIYFDGDRGYKISKYYSDSRNCDAGDSEDVIRCMKKLKEFHSSGITVPHAFNLRERIDFYESLCMKHNCIHFEDYHEMRKKMDELLEHLDSMNITLALSHIDSVDANFLMLPNGDIKLIDWEYAGMCDPLVDLAMFSIYSYYDDVQIEHLISYYLERPAAKEETIRIYSYVALAGFLWALWAEYKSALGDEFGEYTMKMYRYGKRYYKKVMELLK